MKIAILSDIHGNHIALNAVLIEAKKLDVDYLLILGDTVGYYYHPDIVLEYLQEWKYDMIKGNHEIMLEEVFNDPNLSDKIINKYGHGIEMAIKKLKKKQIFELIKLKERKITIIEKLKFELCHGSPWDINSYIYPDSKFEILKKCSNSNADFILMGHTHYHFIFFYNNSLVLNAGSVGQNRRNGGIASWVIINTDNKSIIFNQTPYDTSILINETKKYDKKYSYLWEVLMR